MGETDGTIINTDANGGDMKIILNGIQSYYFKFIFHRSQK